MKAGPCCSFFGCLLFGLFLRVVEASADFKGCSFLFVPSSHVDVLCQHHTRRFNWTLLPTEVTPGLWLFGDPLGDGQRSLLAIVNSRIELHSISFTDNLTLEGLEITSPVWIVNSTVRIDSCSFSPHPQAVLSGGLYVSHKSDVEIVNSTFSGNGHTTIQAGAIRVSHESTLTVKNSAFNNIVSDMAAIYADQASTVKLYDVSFFASVGRRGSAVLIDGGKAIMERSQFFKCFSKERGIVASINAAHLQIADCGFKLNRAKYGGGIYYVNEHKDIDVDTFGVVVKRSKFMSNTVERNGGAIFVYGGRFDLIDSVVANNDFCERGGGIFVEYADVTIQSSKIVGNAFNKELDECQGNGNGAGIWANFVRHFRLASSQLNENKGQFGGGAFMGVVEKLDVIDTTISLNSARWHAGLGGKQIMALNVNGSIFDGNDANVSFAGLSIEENIETNIEKTIFRGNAAPYQVALSAQSCNNVQISSCQFEDNEAYQHAAGLHINAGINVTVKDTSFVRNRARNGTAGLYAVAVDDLRIEGSTFDQNMANQGSAGAFISRLTVLKVISTNFTRNDARNDPGGALRLDNVERAFFDNSTFERNIGHEGGAVAGRSLYRIQWSLTKFVSNIAHLAAGGAINLREADNIIMKSCSYLNNAASMDGGGVSVDNIYNQLEIDDTTFESNEAVGHLTSDGGAMALGVFSTATIKRSRFYNNRASRNGGAISAPTTPRELSRTFDMALSEFKANEARLGSGGAVYFEKAPRLTIRSSTFSLNKASTGGGAFHARSGDLVSVTHSHFDNNQLIADDTSNSFHPTNDQREEAATKIKEKKLVGKQHQHSQKHGGAMKLEYIEHVEIMEVHAKKNKAPGSGGAICINVTEKVTLDSIRLLGNEAMTSGGGLFAQSIGGISLVRSSFIANTVLQKPWTKDRKVSNDVTDDWNGGAVVLKNADRLILEAVNFEKNKATSAGGAIDFETVTDLYAKDCSFKTNTAGRGGAVRILRSERGSLRDCIFEDNTGLGQNIKRPSDNDLIGTIEHQDDEGRDGHGGALMIEQSNDFDLVSPLFRSNWANGHGGGLYCSESTEVTLSASRFLHNRAYVSGGAIALAFGNLSLSVDAFTGNKALNGGVLSVMNGHLNATNIDTSTNSANQYGGTVYCKHPSNISISTSKFVDDGSGEGSAFMAGCDCHLAVVESKIVCSNADVQGCGRVVSDDMCNGDAVIAKTENVVYYSKIRNMLALIIPAVLILPITVLLARGCIRCTTAAVNKAGLSDSEAPLLDKTGSRAVYSEDIYLERGPFWSGTIDGGGGCLGRVGSIRSHQLPEMMVDDVAEYNPSLMNKLEAPILPSVTSKASSSCIAARFTPIASTVSHPILEHSDSRLDVDRSDVFIPVHDQQDFKYEYDQIVSSRASFF